jgi:hypothetical protein
MITRDDLITRLTNLMTTTDKESAHIEADDLLLEYINDKVITQAFEMISKWYS